MRKNNTESALVMKPEKAKKSHNFFKSEGFKSFASSAISVLLGILIGAIVMLIISLIMPDSKPFQGIIKLISGPFAARTKDNKLYNLGNMIFYTVPLIFTGLSVGIAYKTGLFNIGCPGQYLMGAVGALLVGLYLHPTTPAGQVFCWILALLAGMACGALWAIIPGLLKAFFNINEVIIGIMTNWIAANSATLIFTYTKAIQDTTANHGGFLIKVTDCATPSLGLGELFNNSMIDCGIFIAIIVAVALFFIMNKTTFGYQLKACGSNKNASKYAGLNEKRNIILSMAIAGALAGLGAALYYLNPKIEFKFSSQYSKLPDYGFNGIASAFLANCSPIGTIFSSLLIRYLNMGGEFLTSSGFNRYVAEIIISVIIYLAAFTRIFKDLLTKLINKKELVEADAFKLTISDDIKKGESK